MPKFQMLEIQEFELPSSTKDDPAIVTMDLTVTGGTAEDVYGEGDKSRVTSRLLASALRSWNFVDDSGNVAPITPDNVRRLSSEDFEFLANKLLSKLELAASAQAVSEAEKKLS